MKRFIALLTASVIVIALSQASMAQFRESDKNANPGQTTSQPQKAGMVIEDPLKPTVVVPGGSPRNPVTKTAFDPHGQFTFETLSFGNGIRIKSLDKFGLGARNGLEPGDVIKEFNGRAISNQRDLDNAIKSIPKTASGIFIKVVDVNSGTTQNAPYQLTTNAGFYVTNFGELELTESPTTQAGVTNWSGTLFFKNKNLGSSAISGTLSNGRFAGTSTHKKFGVKNVSLQTDITGNMFQGTISDRQGSMSFVMIKN